MINDVDSDGSGSIEFPGDCFHMAEIVGDEFDWKVGFAQCDQIRVFFKVVETNFPTKVAKILGNF